MPIPEEQIGSAMRKPGTLVHKRVDHVVPEIEIAGPVVGIPIERILVLISRYSVRDWLASCRQCEYVYTESSVKC